LIANHATIPTENTQKNGTSSFRTVVTVAMTLFSFYTHKKPKKHSLKSL
jgi:hypothetical protein